MPLVTLVANSKGTADVSATSGFSVTMAVLVMCGAVLLAVVSTMGGADAITELLVM